MPFLTQAKTNWKFIAIVAVLAVIVAAGALLCIKTQESLLVDDVDSDKPKKPETAEIYVGKVEINYDDMIEIQKAVDEGHQPWRLDPESVVMNESIRYGFVSNDFETMQRIFLSVADGIAEYEIIHNGKVYIIVLNQPTIGEDKVWVIYEIKQKEAAWNIYRNEKYGFEFSYPKEWEVDDHSYMPVSDINWLVAINPKILEGSKEWPFLELRNYYTDPLPGTIIDYDEVEFSVEKVPPIGHQVIKILRDGREIYARCALYNFQFYELSKKEIVSLCNQMLSTFRFIEILTPEEKLIEKIANEIIPEGFDKKVIKPDDYFPLHRLKYTFEDLNGDGKEEVILVTSAFESSHEGIERIFIGVATISDNQQNYKKVAGLEHKVGYADTLYTPDFHDFEDIDEDGQKEMFLIHRSAVTMQNNYSYCIFDVDFIKEEIKPLDECFSEWSGAFGGNTFYLEDINKDGKREFVEVISGFSNEPTPKEYCEVKVYKWDGLKLSHNEQLSSLILEEKCKNYLEE